MNEPDIKIVFTILHYTESVELGWIIISRQASTREQGIRINKNITVSNKFC